MNTTSIRIGNHIEGGFNDSFSGSDSCFQIYNKGLNEAEVAQKKNCYDAKEIQTSICPPEYTLLKDICVKVLRNVSKASRTLSLLWFLKMN